MLQKIVRTRFGHAKIRIVLHTSFGHMAGELDYSTYSLTADRCLFMAGIVVCQSVASRLFFGIIFEQVVNGRSVDVDRVDPARPRLNRCLQSTEVIRSEKSVQACFGSGSRNCCSFPFAWSTLP